MAKGCSVARTDENEEPKTTALCDSLSVQASLAFEFWDKFRAPILMIWVASFGAALHSPVNTYFYMELGLTPSMIGVVGSLTSMGVFLSPVSMGQG